MLAESAGVDVAVLDQMTFINLSDLEALDDFLNSTGEDSSCGSSLTSGLFRFEDLKEFLSLYSVLYNIRCSWLELELRHSKNYE